MDLLTDLKTGIGMIKNFCKKSQRPGVSSYTTTTTNNLHPNILACWVKGKTVPSAAKQMIREYIYAYSALSPQTGDCFSMISPLCNTDAMNEF
ncbi:MAG: hypothetical protein ACR2KB_16800, partial [Chitinophagaceae bacterium]